MLKTLETFIGPVEFIGNLLHTILNEGEFIFIGSLEVDGGQDNIIIVNLWR